VAAQVHARGGLCTVVGGCAQVHARGALCHVTTGDKLQNKRVPDL